jgi:acyl carrier protein phosphodiesterase
MIGYSLHTWEGLEPAFKTRQFRVREMAQVLDHMGPTPVLFLKKNEAAWLQSLCFPLLYYI